MIGGLLSKVAARMMCTVRAASAAASMLMVALGLAVASTVSCAFAPDVALAADPVLTPMAIKTVDFDSPSSQLDVGEVVSERPAYAYWGPITATRRGSSGQGLWCAGTSALPAPGPSTFFPAYPYFGQLADQRAEPVTMTLTLPRRLKYQGASGSPVSNIFVRSAPGSGTIYRRDKDYKVAVDNQGYTTIQRLSAGTIPAGAVVYVDYKFPSAGTRGVATLRLPEAAGFYRVLLSFHYLMPSYGAADENSFSVNWHQQSKPDKTDARWGFRRTGASDWRRVDLDLSAGEYAPLSREAGLVNFQFFDFNDPAGATKNGQGASIDDITVSGFKYGAVRAVSASLDGAAMRLSWLKPSRSLTNGAPDDRSLTYRVWRRPLSSSTWTELTTERLTDTQYRDTSRSAGESYVYLIQAWDPGTGHGYGEPGQWRVTPSGQVTRASSMTLSVPPTPRFGQGVVLTGRFADASGAGIETRALLIEYARSGTGPWSVAATLSTDAFGAFDHTVRTDRSLYVRARYTDAEFGTVTSPVRRVLPMVGLTTPVPSKRTVRVNERFSVSGTMRPAHSVGTALILEASRPGAATKRFRVKVTARTSSSCTWRGTAALPSAGTWRIRVVHPLDSLHARTVSGSASVTAR